MYIVAIRDDVYSACFTFAGVHLFVSYECDHPLDEQQFILTGIHS